MLGVTQHSPHRACNRTALMNLPASHVPTQDQHDLTAEVVRALTLYCFAEVQSGHAATIRITVEGNSFTIADDGRGHSIDRTIDGTPYLKFIYTHFDYPFETGQNTPVQLQGIGMSLVNALCSELVVTVRKQEVTLQLTFLAGRLCGSELVNVSSAETGIVISGKVIFQTQKSGVGVQKLQKWLLGLLAASPSLNLFFNGHQLHAPPKSDA